MRRRSFLKRCLAGGATLWLPASDASTASQLGFFQSRAPASGGTAPGAPTEFWRLENVNGSVASQTLTNNGSVTFTAGKLSNAATFSGSNSLTRASNSTLQVSTVGFSWGGWFKPTDVSAEQTIIAKHASVNGLAEYSLRCLANGTVSATFFNDVPETYTTTTVGTATFGAWNFALAVFDQDNSLLKVYLNGAAAASSAASGTPLADGTLFCLGKSTDDLLFFTGQIDAVLWYRATALTSSNATYLWNGGAGREYYSSAWH